MSYVARYHNNIYFTSELIHGGRHRLAQRLIPYIQFDHHTSSRMGGGGGIGGGLDGRALAASRPWLALAAWEEPGVWMELFVYLCTGRSSGSGK